MLHLQACFAIPLFHPALTFASSRPSQCLSRISVCGFLSSPLIVLSKRLKLTRNVLVGHCLGRPEYGPCRVQIFFAQHFRLHNPSLSGITPRTTTNHRETNRTIAQTFISALHLFETMILRFTIDHPRASLVVGTWLLLARRLPSDIGRSAGNAVVRQVRSRGH